MNARIFLLTLLAMLAFASNSLLCRVALRDTTIDAATFTTARLVSGAIALLAIPWLRARSKPPHFALTGTWLSALALFVYAAGFSFAYRNLAAGTGALLLFGAVQATMILWNLRQGERLIAIQVLGLFLAIAGLVALIFPGLTAPPLGGAILMILAGVAWGVYSLRGKNAGEPVAATTGNFVRSVPFALTLSLLFLATFRYDALGLIYAVISGAITSGLGYVIWYAALPGLRPASAATVQLSVPVLTATAGILLLSEPLTIRYSIASIAILGGIALVIFCAARRT